MSTAEKDQEAKLYESDKDLRSNLNIGSGIQLGGLCNLNYSIHALNIPIKDLICIIASHFN